MKEFVVDCSVAMSWHFEEETSAYTDAILEALRTRRACVPVLFFHEVANVLLVAERKGRTTRTKVDEFMAELAVLPFEMDAESPVSAWLDLMALARAHDLTAYDAAYLELAQRHGLPLATLDKPLKSAAARAGISTDLDSIIAED